MKRRQSLHLPRLRGLAGGYRIWQGALFSLAPLLRGEGRGEGRFSAGSDSLRRPLTRIAQMRDPTSPRLRGEVMLRYMR
jgi:hypothetical protein